jgi:hypothetical protein
MADKPQSFENHARFVPLYHGFVLSALAVNLLWSCYKAVVAFSADRLVAALVAAALVVLTFYARMFAVCVQDRVIRLEMRLRLRALLPADLQARIGEFTLSQLIGLRFASDAELPALAAQVLRDNIQDRTAIKKMIKDWQADYLRV